VLTEAEFRNAVAPPRAARGKKNRVLIFVHGFNNNFQESLYWLVQLHVDAADGSTPILFTWPLQAAVGAYAIDQAEAIKSRDDPIALLKMVTGSPQVGDVMVLAHSMGGMLTAEALRELRTQRQDRVIARLSRVILAAPDIDVDVFRTQVQTIGPLRPPFLVLVSKDDRALNVSNTIGGSRARAGALDVDNPLVRDAALRHKVKIVDISQLHSHDGEMHHDRFVSLAALYQKVQRQAREQQYRTGAFTFDAASARAVQVGDQKPAN